MKRGHLGLNWAMMALSTEFLSINLSQKRRVVCKLKTIREPLDDPISNLNVFYQYILHVNYLICLLKGDVAVCNQFLPLTNKI